MKSQDFLEKLKLFIQYFYCSDSDDDPFNSDSDYQTSVLKRRIQLITRTGRTSVHKRWV